MPEKEPIPGRDARKRAPRNKQRPFAPKRGRIAEKLDVNPWFFAITHSATTNVLLCLLIPAAATLTLEWIARGSLGDNIQGNGFFQSLTAHFPSFLLSYAMLAALYVLVSQLTARHWIATLAVGLTGNVPAIVTHFKMNMRGEPFLPWDISQIGDLMGVKSSVELTIPASVYIVVALWAVLTVAAGFVCIPRGVTRKTDWSLRLVSGGVALALFLGLLNGVMLNPAGAAAMGIVQDPWMQDRYYRTNGVITGFLTNLQWMQIAKPEDYSEDAVREIEAWLSGEDARAPLFEDGYAAKGGQLSQWPDIIYLMAESFWDVTALRGIAYDQPLLDNLNRLSRQGARGTAYTPSFGGGTCDVEFEALTGFSMEFLPSGAKPFQQYVTEDMFALPRYLKSSGYSTVAVHGYGRRFWNRDMAYPNLGIDTFIASEDFINPETKRGFISDNAMVDEMIRQLENRTGDAPVFMHAVTMQNHTTYNRNKYPANQLVRVTSAPMDVSDSVVGQLEDCATGIRDMDAALGKLADYLAGSERPAILVFWGDHMNPMSDGYNLFEQTGYIENGDTASPRLRETPLLIWSNFDETAVDLGTLATYNITTAMMDLYGFEKPPVFDFLAKSFEVIRGRTRGITIGPDNGYTEEFTPEQRQFFDRYAILQYDYLFGNNYHQKAHSLPSE